MLRSKENILNVIKKPILVAAVAKIVLTRVHQNSLVQNFVLLYEAAYKTLLGFALPSFAPSVKEQHLGQCF